MSEPPWLLPEYCRLRPPTAPAPPTAVERCADLTITHLCETEDASLVRQLRLTHRSSQLAAGARPLLLVQSESGEFPHLEHSAEEARTDSVADAMSPALRSSW